MARFRHPLTTLLAGALAAGLLAGRPAAAQVQVRLRANASEISIANNFQVSAIIEGASGEIEYPALEGEGFQVLNRSYEQSSGITLLGGRQRRQSTITINYILRPTRSGTIEIQPVAVKIGGQVYKSPAGLKIEVQPIQPQDNLILELQGPAKGLYIDQEFTVTLRIYARRLGKKYGDSNPFVEQGRDLWPQLTIPWFQGQEDFQSEDFQKFASARLSPQGEAGFPINNLSQQDFFERAPYRFQLPRSEATRKASDGREYPYFVYTLSKNFRAQKTGKFLFGGVLAKGKMATDLGGTEPRLIPIVAQSEPVEIAVKSPPEEGRPTFFTGAVGKWKVSAAVKPAKVWVGEPLTLTVSVQGDGPLDSVGPPPLASQEGMDAHFRIHEEPSTGISEPEKRTKTFTYGIRAKSSDVKAIPPIAFAYFDTEEETYVTVKTVPLPIQVEAGKGPGGEFFDPVRGGPSRSEVQVLDQTLYTLYEEPDALQSATPPSSFGAIHAAFLVVPPLASLLYLGLMARQRRLRADPALLKARKAHRMAAQILREASAALKKGDVPEVHAALARAVARLVGDRLRIPSAGMTAGDAREALHAAGVEEKLVEEAVLVFERADGARYGTARESREDLGKQVESTGDLLRKLQASLASRKAKC